MRAKREIKDHPVFELQATDEERADWAEARHFADNLVRYATGVRDYLSGDAGDPSTANGALTAALRVSSAFDRALARRHTRLLMKRRARQRARKRA